MSDLPLTDPELQAHFQRIRQQPAHLQTILLAKLSCGLRLPQEKVQTLYQQFCQDHPSS